METVTLMEKRCKARIVRADGQVAREIDVTAWPIEKFNALRHEYSVLGLDVRLKWVHEPAKA